MHIIENHLKQKFSNDIKDLKQQQKALINLLMGEVMRLSNGRVNPQKARQEILKQINT